MRVVETMSSVKAYDVVLMRYVSEADIGCVLSERESSMYVNWNVVVMSTVIGVSRRYTYVTAPPSYF